jgi:mono/diheme cytochrome c family protein
MIARLMLLFLAVLSGAAAIGLGVQTPLRAQSTEAPGQPGQKPDQSGTVEEKPYIVRDGRIDRAGFNGWRRYTESCLRCHGPDGAGSSYGPSLVDSLKQMSEEDFKEVVINGRISTVRRESVMPPFGMVEDVALYIDDIYAYLKARSDGVLARGRPERFDR